MVARVHAGEMIVPAGPAAGLRSALSGGGVDGGSGGGDTHLHLNVTAMDAQSVVGLFKNNGRELAKVVGNMMRSNPSTRGGYRS